jgi:hypothetical protein
MVMAMDWSKAVVQKIRMLLEPGRARCAIGRGRRGVDAAAEFAHEPGT